MKKIVKGIHLILVGLLMSCESTEQKLLQYYQSHPEYFQEFVNAAYHDPILDRNRNKYVRYSELSESTRTALQKLELQEISFVILGGMKCYGKEETELEIIFNGSWHLQYESCREPGDEDQYSKLGFIEVLKIDRQWFLWVNNDFIG